MPERLIVNASPLITLAKVGHIDLLAMDGEVIVPEAEKLLERILPEAVGEKWVP